MTAYVVGLYLGITHSEGLNILKKAVLKVLTEDIGKTVDFVLKNSKF